ncbi:MAG: hypothetical protein WBA25_13590 [Jannaschia sp.]
MNTNRTILISALSALVLLLLLVSRDWSGAGGWERIVGILLLLALAANVWTIWRAWSTRGSRPPD